MNTNGQTATARKRAGRNGSEMRQSSRRWLLARVRPDADTPNTMWRLITFWRNDPRAIHALVVIRGSPLIFECRGPYLTMERATTELLALINALPEPLTFPWRDPKLSRFCMFREPTREERIVNRRKWTDLAQRDPGVREIVERYRRTRAERYQSEAKPL